MNDRSTSDDARRRAGVPWEWEARRVRRLRIARRAAIGIAGLLAVSLLILAIVGR